MKSPCIKSPDCKMTAGYYLGGGQWVCWLHALYDSALFKLICTTRAKMEALPREKGGE